MHGQPEISPADALDHLKGGTAVFLDIRDGHSFHDARIPDALHVTDANVADLLATLPRDRPVIVYCYHGHSSLGGAAFFREQGVSSAVSMSGGFERWRMVHPENVQR